MKLIERGIVVIRVDEPGYSKKMEEPRRPGGQKVGVVRWTSAREGCAI